MHIWTQCWRWMPNYSYFLKARVTNQVIRDTQKNSNRYQRKRENILVDSLPLLADWRSEKNRTKEGKEGKKQNRLGLKKECFGRVLLPRCKGLLLASAHSCRVTIYNRPPFLPLAVLRLRKIIKRPSFLLFVLVSLSFPVAPYDEINAILPLSVELFRFRIKHQREFASFSPVFRFSCDDFQPRFSSFCLANLIV